MSDIQPCPFCGGPATPATAFIDGRIAWVECETCDATGPSGQDKADAITAWNRRASIKTDDAMVLVPREPTPAILEAFDRMDHWLKTAEGYRYLVQAHPDGARGEPHWKAMIEAAQQGGVHHA